MNLSVINPATNPTLQQVALVLMRKDPTKVPTSDDLDKSILSSVAEQIMGSVPAEVASVWDDLSVRANKETCGQFVNVISSGKYDNYRAVVDSFSGPCDRLIAIHLANALIANEIPIKAAYALNLASFKPTRYLMSGEIRYSLKPFKSAYFPNLDTFNSLFSAYCLIEDITKHGCIDLALLSIVEDIVSNVPVKTIWNYNAPAKDEYSMPLGDDVAVGHDPMSTSGLC